MFVFENMFLMKIKWEMEWKFSLNLKKNSHKQQLKSYLQISQKWVLVLQGVRMGFAV